jgi:septum formation protein
MSLILASKSRIRSDLLANAGIDFETEGAEIDERAVEDAVSGSGITPGEVATILAEAKALAVSERHPSAIVIGADQTLSLDDEILHKTGNMEAARRRLLQLSGRTHMLNSAVVLVRNGEAVWRHLSEVQMTMRPLTPGFIGRHLSRTGDQVLASVGAYQLEGEGIQLFEKIEGDYFAVLGLPLLPLLEELRHLGEIDG